MSGKVQSFKDLEVYQKLFGLHILVHKLTLSFPKFEMYELGSQLRRSSNSIPANIAEGWNNSHVSMYLEGINRASGELQETMHHIAVAYEKGYLTKEHYESITLSYNDCSKMLWGLRKSLQRFKA